MLDNADASVQKQITHIIYTNLISCVILYYDYALTLSLEVDRFWSRSFTWASCFFYINRYVTLFGHIPILFQDYWDSQRPHTEVVCPGLAAFHQYIAVAIQVVVGILLIMRTYALYERSTWILLFLCTCGLAVVVFGAWSVVTGHYTKKDVKYSSLGCVLPIDVSDANHFAAAWTGMLFLDTLIFSMTVYKSFRRSRGGDRPLLDVLLRDGAIYFGIMAAVGLANILTFHLSHEYEQGFIMTFHNIISSTMISRLMLNLRDPALAAPHTEARSVTGPIEFNPGTNATTTIGLGSRY